MAMFKAPKPSYGPVGSVWNDKKTLEHLEESIRKGTVTQEFHHDPARATYKSSKTGGRVTKEEMMKRDPMNGTSMPTPNIDAILAHSTWTPAYTSYTMTPHTHSPQYYKTNTTMPPYIAPSPGPVGNGGPTFAPASQIPPETREEKYQRLKRKNDQLFEEMIENQKEMDILKGKIVDEMKEVMVE